MVQYPDCPFCGNSNTALSIVDVVIGGENLKGIQCNAPDCSKFIGFFKDYNERIKSIDGRLDELESRIEDVER